MGHDALAREAGSGHEVAGVVSVSSSDAAASTVCEIGSKFHAVKSVLSVPFNKFDKKWAIRMEKVTVRIKRKQVPWSHSDFKLGILTTPEIRRANRYNFFGRGCD